MPESSSLILHPSSFYDAYILDLDGTVYLGDALLPNAYQAITTIRNAGKRTVFLSNNPTHTRLEYSNRLTRLGLPTPPEDIINSSAVMVDFLQHTLPNAKLFVCGEQPLIDDLRAGGFSFSDNPIEIAAVIASFDRTFTYSKLQIAFDAVRAGARFFATNADRYCPIPGGGQPDAASIIAAIEACTDKPCEAIVGKPSIYMMKAVLNVLQMPPEQCIITGDRLETDVQMGLSAGMATALTLTGATTLKDVERSPTKPHFILNDLSDLLPASTSELCVIKHQHRKSFMTLDYPHRRFNELTREWVLVSPHRARRPWLGQVEKTPPENLPTYDPACYLCPGNSRAGGVKNPVYESTFVFDNDFAALLPDTATGRPGDNANEVTLPLHYPVTQSSLLIAEPEPGLCRVVCFSPRHDLTLPELSQAEVEEVIRTWTDQTRELGRRDFINYVQVFENKGAIMGCSNPHPHSQIWAVKHLPNEPQKEYNAQQRYWLNQNACLMCDYLAEELQRGERHVAANEDFTALVPFWAVWPFEIIVIANHHCGSLNDLSGMEQASLADILRRVTARYDNLFEISFPYSMGFHQAPTDGHAHEEWHLHAHFYPPLLRSATVKKFMVGYEMLAEAQRDLTPEQAAEKLRGLSEVHYRVK